MKTWVFTHRWTGRTLGQAEAETRIGALQTLVVSEANLSGADLSGADLRGADLSEADLSGADLSGADLREANLSEADLRGANLSGANLIGANLREANLIGADLSGADLRGAKNLEGIAIPKLHTLIAEAVGDCGDKLNMNNWHTCDTTHCRGGWAVHLAGKQGETLENKYGPNVTAALIYRASYPDEKVPNFYAADHAALADIKACAEREAAMV